MVRIFNMDQQEKNVDRDNDTTPVLSGSESCSALLLIRDNSSVNRGVLSNELHGQVEETNNNKKNAEFQNIIEYGYGGEIQPRSTARRCPWRGLTMSVILLLFGTLLLTGGIALISGTFHLKGLDTVTPYLILVFGALCFIPGAYHILVACCALRGHERFSFDDIPYFS